MSFIPPELLIQFFEPLPLRDLISATHVCQQWRALVPKIDSPTRLRLLSLAFNDVESPHPISSSARISYVINVETTHNVLIPEPYRTVLTEWPSSQPPPGMHWPHSVRFFDSGFCFCPRHTHEDPEICLCAERPAVRHVVVMVPERTFKLIMANQLPADEDYSWELFNNPVRLYTDEQNAQTVRFIRAHPAAEVRWTRSWANIDLQVLPLSRYHFASSKGTSDGIFVMILDGPTRGQIHAWSSSGDTWYDGFEAENFWDWNYVEWDRDAFPVPSDEGETEGWHGFF
ncbi:hypothetical protein FB451DRAFT_710771 [Mycena latifolia]|nr:hypothetical protein FB451DRAFT_710771 [Mycena latifolia]